jgi:hypothetical protein
MRTFVLLIIVWMFPVHLLASNDHRTPIETQTASHSATQLQLYAVNPVSLQPDGIPSGIDIDRDTISISVDLEEMLVAAMIGYRNSVLSFLRHTTPPLLHLYLRPTDVFRPPRGL